MKKIVSAIYLVLFSVSVSSSQPNPEVDRYFDNGLAKFNILMSGGHQIAENKREARRYYVTIDVPKAIHDTLLHCSKDFWMSKLSNEQTDWATNVLLYYLYNRDAITLAYLFPDRKKWMGYKKNDINYWASFLDSVKNHPPR